MLIFYFVTGSVAGLVIGSFTTALMYRDANHISMIVTQNNVARSKCATCGHQLSWKDLLPLISWVLLWGRCRYCQTKISLLYPLIEIFCAVSLGLFFLAYGFTIPVIFYAACMPPLIVLIVNSMRGYKISGKLAIYFLFFSILGAVLNILFVNDIWQALFELGGTVVLYTFVAIVISLLLVFFYKQPLRFTHLFIFTACGLWLGREILPIYGFAVILSFVFVHSFFGKVCSDELMVSILSPFLIISLSVVFVDNLVILQSVY